jgi:hypothetical protein
MATTSTLKLSRAIQRRERAIARLQIERKWMEQHGSTEAAYVKRYGSRNDPDHYGDGGEAIYAADKAVLDRAEQEALDAIAECRRAAQRPHRMSILTDGRGHTAHCGCGWQGTTMVAGPHSHQAAIDQYAGHLRSAREGHRQGVIR